MLSGVRIGAHRIPASTKGDSSRMRAMTWPALLSALAVFLIASLVTPTVGQDKSGTLRFGVGPLQPRRGEGLAGRREGQTRVVCRCRLDLRLADPDRLVPHEGHQPEGVLQLLRRRNARGERDLGREWPGRLRDGFRPES